MPAPTLTDVRILKAWIEPLPDSADVACFVRYRRESPEGYRGEMNTVAFSLTNAQKTALKNAALAAIAEADGF